MPLVQLPLLSDIGIAKDKDTVGTNPNHAFFLNGYFEKTDSSIDSYKYAFVKRQGTQLLSTTGNFTNNHKINGMATSHIGLELVLYTNNGVTNSTWIYDSLTGVLTNNGLAPAAAGTWTISGPVYFTKVDNVSYGNNYWAATDLTKGAVVSGAGVFTEIVDVDYTGLVKVTNFVALDGYLFQGTTNNRIYNSDLNTPTSWQALSFLSVSDVPGGLRWLGRLRNYLIAFKQNSVEFFEDVGNPQPGSPLEARKQLNRAIGCVNPGTIQEVSDGIIFAGRGLTGAIKLYKINRNDLQIVEISDRYIEQCLNTGIYNQTGAPIDPTITGGGFGQSQVIYQGGKEFYMINLPQPNTAAAKYFGFVFDNDLAMWTAWVTSCNTSGTNDTNGFLPSQGQLLMGVPQSSTILERMVYAHNFTSAVGAPPVLVQSIERAPVWQDYNAKNYNFSWTSQPLDFGNNKRKFLDVVELIYDIRSDGTPDTTTGDSTITVTYKDLDYTSATTGYTVTRTLPLDSQRGIRCKAGRWGSFRRRVMSILYTANTALRLWGIEIQYNQGEIEQQG